MNLNDLFAALRGGQWVFAGALFVGGFVALSKQGWLGSYIAKKLPPSALPYFSVTLGVVGLSATEIVSGKPLWPAIVDGIQAGILAVFGHETVVEGMRGGKELVPEKKSAFLDPPAPCPERPIMTKLTHSVPVLAASVALAVIAACAAVPAITKTVVCTRSPASRARSPTAIATFEGIALACGRITVEDVVLIAWASLAASKSPVLTAANLPILEPA